MKHDLLALTFLARIVCMHSLPVREGPIRLICLYEVYPALKSLSDLLRIMVCLL